MAKKAELIEQAKKLKLEVSEKSTIKELEALIASANEEKENDGHSQETDQTTVQATGEGREVAEKAPAKAGKRSAKGQKEEAETAEKLEKQAHADETSDQPEKKGPAPKVRSLLDRKSKNHKKASELVDKSKAYSLKEASELLPKTSLVKFDASVELHVNLGVDPKQADQNIRTSVSLPHGTGKSLRVAVFAPSDQLDAAKKAGADIAEDDAFLQQLEKEDINFDVLISTPAYMAKLGKYARILGPKGLMPNPKSGTVTAKVASAVKDAKGGKVEFRVDKQSIIHQTVGKVSFKPEQILENTKAVLKTIADAKPASVKGVYIKSISMTTTMGPSIKIAVSEV